MSPEQRVELAKQKLRQAYASEKANKDARTSIFLEREPPSSKKKKRTTSKLDTLRPTRTGPTTTIVSHLRRSTSQTHPANMSSSRMITSSKSNQSSSMHYHHHHHHRSSSASITKEREGCVSRPLAHTIDCSSGSSSKTGMTYVVVSVHMGVRIYIYVSAMSLHLYCVTQNMPVSI